MSEFLENLIQWVNAGSNDLDTIPKEERIRLARLALSEFDMLLAESMRSDLGMRAKNRADKRLKIASQLIAENVAEIKRK